MNSLQGLSTVHIELTSRCNKNCWMCGRRERDRLYSDLEYGDMDLKVMQKIASEIPPATLVHLHNNGEPTLYPFLHEALIRFSSCVTHMDTNGKLLLAPATDIVNLLNSLSISIIENDPEADEQFSILNDFLEIKGARLPFVNLRFLGDVDRTRYKKFGLLEITRTIHAPKGSISYRKPPVIPETGICQEILSHLAVDRYGDVSVCVRFDPDRELVLGNIKEHSLVDLWNSRKRLKMLHKHCKGERKNIPFCNDKCHYWGIPTC